jgi:hypothetical protein
MEASIKDGNIKSKPHRHGRRGKSILTFLAFVKLLQCASKFGDDLNISANKDLVRIFDPERSILISSGNYQ